TISKRDWSSDVCSSDLDGYSLATALDDVIERGGQRIAVTRAERSPDVPAGEPVDDVMGDAVAFLLADLEVLGQGRVLGVVGQQVVQQQTRPLHVAPGLLHQRHQGAVRTAAQEPHRAGARRKLTARAY